MAREQIISTLRFAMPALRADFGICGLSLFGSIARGVDTSESDVDIIVEFEPTKIVTLFTLAGLQERLCELLGRKVDVGTISSLRPRVRASVESELLRVA